jgi:uncharacterized protein (DUF2252 family)
MDVKEAARTAAHRAAGAQMPVDQGERVVEAARHLSPFLGKRMRAVKLLGKSTDYLINETLVIARRIFRFPGRWLGGRVGAATTC